MNLMTHLMTCNLTQSFRLFPTSFILFSVFPASLFIICSMAAFCFFCGRCHVIFIIGLAVRLGLHRYFSLQSISFIHCKIFLLVLIAFFFFRFIFIFLPMFVCRWEFGIQRLCFLQVS